MSVTKQWLLAAAMVLSGAALAASPASAQVISDTGNQISGLNFDLATGRVTLQTNQNVVNLSALDPNRGVVDPGSWQPVNYKQYDSSGILWHYTGYRWRSYGVPHSQITRRSLTSTGIGGLAVQQTQTQARSMATNRQRNNQQPIQRRVGQPRQDRGAYGQW